MYMAFVMLVCEADRFLDKDSNKRCYHDHRNDNLQTLLVGGDNGMSLHSALQGLFSQY